MAAALLTIQTVPGLMQGLTTSEQATQHQHVNKAVSYKRPQ